MTPFEYFSIMDNYLCLYELAVIHKMKYIQHQKNKNKITAQSLPIGIGGGKAEMQHPIYLILVFRAPYSFRRTDNCPFYQNMIEVEAENCQVLEFDKSSLELDFAP